jgi:hypothetical protein
MKYSIIIFVILASGADAQSAENMLPDSKSTWPLQREVTLERYSWLDALDISLRSILDPSVLTQQTLVSAVGIDSLIDATTSEDLLSVLRGQGDTWSTVDYTSTGFAIAMNTDSAIYNLEEIKCSSIDCVAGDLRNITTFEDLPTASILISADRNGLAPYGGDVFELQAQGWQ